MARVAVIIPARNCANFILLTLHYALRQDFKDLEIVVVNDGSTDNLLEVLDGIDSRVRIITQANAGMSAARNRGISDSDSEFIALLDADDIWHPQKVRAQVQALQARPDHDFCFGEFQTWSDSMPVNFKPEMDPSDIVPELSGWVYHKFLLTCWALPSTLLWRRRVNQKIGLFPQVDNQTDDWEYMIHATREFQFVKLRDTVTLYRQHAQQISRKLRSRDVTAEMREQMIAKFGYVGPDGTHVDTVELEKRRYRANLAFGSAHLSSGELFTGLKYVASALRQRPLKMQSYLVAPKALVKRQLLRLA